MKILFLYLFLQNIIISSNIERSNNNWNTFRESHSFQTVYLVYGGPYPSSPSSSFGHLFLLLEPKNNSRPLLLWDAVDFSANAENLGAIKKFYKGIFGGLNGTYKIIPFYEKLREYTFIESRPLWLFPLEISKTESDTLLRNIFNVQKVKYQYRFHDKNCASQIENLLRISFDEDSISSNIIISPRKVLAGLEDRTKRPMFIESVENIINNSFIDVSKEFDEFETDIPNLEDSEAIVLLNILEWKYSHKNSHLTLEEEEQLKTLRLRVSEAKEKKTIKLREYKNDFYIHPPMLFGSGVSYLNNINMEYSILYRFGLHDFFENSYVFPEYDFLSAINLDVGISKSKIRINKLMIFEQLSLQPITPLIKYTSWKLGLGAIRKNEFSFPLLASGLFASIGYTLPMFNKNLNLSFLIDFEPVHLESYGFTILTGPEIISRIALSNTIKWMGIFGGTINTFNKLNICYFAESNLAFELPRLTTLLFKIKYAKYNSSVGLQVLYYLN